jgi:hypothetical protein
VSARNRTDIDNFSITPLSPSSGMKTSFSVLLGALAFASVGCSGDDGPTVVNRDPQAFIRYINASPDSPALDARFVDKVENTRTLFSVAFRGNSGFYQGVNAGTRQFRVFRASDNLEVAQTVVLDTSITLQANAHYTMVQVGRALIPRGTAGAAQLVVYPDTFPASVPTGQVAIRTYHTATGVGNVNVYVTPGTATGTTGAVTSATNVPFLARSPYVNVPVLTGTTALYRWAVTPAATPATVLIQATPSLPGQAAQAASTTAPALNATAGVRQAGSVISAFVFPAAVAGSPAATTATATGTVVLLPDRNPPAP